MDKNTLGNTGEVQGGNWVEAYIEEKLKETDGKFITPIVFFCDTPEYKSFMNEMLEYVREIIR